MMTKTTINYLTELRDRLSKAADELTRLRSTAITVETIVRLHGKIEGVNLAISYLDEEIRQLRNDMLLGDALDG